MVLGGREHALSLLVQVCFCFSRGMERAVFVLMEKGVFVFIRKNKLKSRRDRQ